MAFVKAGEKADGFDHAHFVRQSCSLKRGAYFLLEGIRFALRVEAADGDEAAIGITQAFEDFDSRRFPCAIGTEKPENFTFFDRKTHAAHGFHVAVALDEVLHLKDWIRHFPCPTTRGRTG